jgi:anti-sigma factor RsiW
MTNELQHDEVEELLGAYALDAVDDEERQAVERHFAECPRCRAEVDAHLEMAGALGNGIETPPAGLWDRIADRVAASERAEGAPPMPDLAVARTSGAAIGGAAAGSAAGVDEVARARADRASRTPRSVMALVTVAAAAVIVIALLAINLSRVDNRVGQIQSAVGSQSSQAVINQALANPHRLVSLKSPSGERLAEFVVAPDGRGYMIHSTMPPLPASQTYQLWGFIAGKPISLGLLGSHPSEASFTVAGSPGPSQLAVTIEPAGGVSSPDRAPVASGALIQA